MTGGSGEGAKDRGEKGGRRGAVAPVIVSLAAGSAHGSRGPRVPLASARFPSLSVPVPTCSALGPEPGSSSGRSERSPAPHPPAAPSPPRADAATAPALKRIKRNRKRMHAKKKKIVRSKRRRRGDARAAGGAGVQEQLRR